MAHLSDGSSEKSVALYTCMLKISQQIQQFSKLTFKSKRTLKIKKEKVENFKIQKNKSSCSAELQLYFLLLFYFSLFHNFDVFVEIHRCCRQ